jgi:hypothetical protein
MAMIRYLAKTYKKIAWVDAGLLASYVYDHDFSKYHNLFDPEKITKLFEVFKTYNSMLASFDDEPATFHMPLSVIKNYAAQIKENPDIKYITAAVMFYSQKNFNAFFYDFKKFWMQHIIDGHAGIEENALTLMALKNEIKSEKITDILKMFFI